MVDSGSMAIKEFKRCPAGEGIEVLQEKWVLHIVHALLAGPKGFNELGRDVGGCNPTTLTQRLARLEVLGVVQKEVHSTASSPVPPRCSYTLTPAGHDLERVISAIRSWAVAHLAGEEAGEHGTPDAVPGADGEASIAPPPAT